MSLAAVLDVAIASLPKSDRARRIDRSLHDPEIRLTRDPDRTAQALLRLLANACRFSSSMTPIGIRSRIETADDRDHLVVTIADRGVGISRAHQHRVFEPFWRGPQTGETPGQGMGLPIARRLIEAQGGWIELRSALGVGTEVEVWLPPELSADRPA
jgi:signal transduction histidine kinase